MKVLHLLIVVMAALFSGNFIRQCFSGWGYATEELPIARYQNGPDNLTLKWVHTTGWNNSYTSVQLLFNNRLVDYIGRIRDDSQYLGRVRVLPVHREDRHQLKVETLFQPKAGEAIWMVWVYPKQFSAADYKRIKTLLVQGRYELRTQQDDFYRKLDKNAYLINATVRLSAMNPAQVVYFDHNLLKDRQFIRIQGGQQDEITLTIGGQVNIARIKGQPNDYGHTLGELDDTGDTLRVDMYQWKASQLYFPIDQLTDFTDSQGRSLTSRYRVVEK